MNTKEQENNRNPDGTFKPGASGNPNGRPRDTLKAFIAREFREMDDNAKRLWLEEKNISGEVIWKMAEGNPDNKSQLDAKVEMTVAPEVKEMMEKALDDI